MSAESKNYREAAKEKAERLVRSGKTRVDASDFTAQDAIDSNGHTGMLPVSKRNYQRGGSVFAGLKSQARADRKPRASGGKTAMTPVSYMNRDMKEANEDRDGIHFKGGYKRGGRTGKLAGGPLIQATGSDPMPPTTVGRKEGGSVHGASCGCAKCNGGRVGRKEGGKVGGNPVFGGTRPVAGRIARKGGGRTKGKTNVNIIITQPGAGGPPMPPPGAMPPPGGPAGLHQAPPPPMAPGPGVPAGMPMGRKRGGRTNYPIDAGAGSGLGRLEKAKAYG
jgi:hypothetical protein